MTEERRGRAVRGANIGFNDPRMNRRWQVASAVASGQTYAEAGAQLGVSDGRIEQEVLAIKYELYRRANARGDRRLAHWAIQLRGVEACRLLMLADSFVLARLAHSVRESPVA